MAFSIACGTPLSGAVTGPLSSSYPAALWTGTEAAAPMHVRFPPK